MLEDRRLLAAAPIPLGNINTTTGSSSPGPNSSGYVEMGGFYYFSANDGVNGSELWKSDGTAAGTVMVKDINPGGGFAQSFPTNFTAMGGMLYFIADDGTNSTKVWKTDGTTAGTTMVDTSGGTNTTGLVAIGSTLYFAKTTTGNGTELFKSTGAVGNTTLVKEIRASTASSSPTSLTAVGSTLYFVANDGTTGEELYKSDGTSAGTVRVTNLHPTGNGVDTELIAYGGMVYFAGHNGMDWGLYKSGGTTATTTRLKTVYGNQFGVAGGKLYFSGNDELGAGTELWVSAGTAATTMMVKDIVPGAGDSNPNAAIEFNGGAIFQAASGLWFSDGTEAGTTQFTYTPEGAASVPSFGVFGSTIIFSGTTSQYGAELWKSDGTTAGSAMVKDVNATEVSAGVNMLGQVNGRVVFRANDGVHGTELWVSDGTAAGTFMLKDIRTGSANSSPNGGVSLDGNTLIFYAFDDVHGLELWSTDGTVAGTMLLADINPTDSSGPSSFARLGGFAYFAASEGVNGTELWRTDGTVAGTELVKNIHPTGSSSPGNFVAVGNRLFFTANDGVTGAELWITDGTTAGTQLVKDVNGVVGNSFISSITPLGEGIVFTANVSVGIEVWFSDGTNAGTVLLKDINLGSNSSNPSHLTNINGRVYFSANDGVHGHELWVTEGTPATTGMVIDLNPNGDSSPAYFTAYNDAVYFRADNGITGWEVFKTDGTANGTQLVVDLALGGASDPTNLSVANGMLYFSAAGAGGAGRELWRTDGTSGGTELVADLTPGVASSTLGTPFVIDGTIYFIASTPVTGNGELWAIPGPTTMRVADGDLLITENPLVDEDNDLHIVLDAATQELVITDANQPLVKRSGSAGAQAAANVVRIPLAAIADGQLQIDLGEGADRVTLDMSGGFFELAGGVNFVGDGDDQLVVIGNQAESADYTSASPGAATVSLSLGVESLIISGTGLVKVDLSAVDSLGFATGGGVDSLNVSVTQTGAAPATALLTGDSGGVGITALAVSLISALQIDLGVGDAPGDEDDSLTVTGAGLAALELKQLSIATGTGSDNILAAAGDFNVAELFELTGASVGLSNGLSLEGSMTFVVQGQVLGQVIAGNLVTVVAEASSTLGNGWSFRGVDVGGELVVGPWTVLLNSAALARLGALTTLDGGTLIANNGFALGDGDAIAGSGALDGRLAAATGSSITATGDLHLGKASSPAGFASDGELQVFDHLVTLVDANEAVLGSLTTLGTETDDGTLVAANGFLLGEGRNLSGRGAISGEFHNDGHVISTGTLVFDSLVSGVGDFSGDVTFNGGVSPGHSPASIDLDGDVTFGASNSLHIELGGTQAGGQHDQLQIAGAATLDGTLSVTLINGFTPAAGDLFDVVTSGGVSGTFSGTSLPALAEGLEWSIEYSTGGVTLAVIESGLAADFDTDGDVDGYDVLAWQRGLGISTGATKQDGDADNDSDVDANDLGAWTEQFGGEAAAAASAASSAASQVFSLPAGAWLTAPAVEASASDDGDAAEQSVTEFAKAASASAFDDIASLDSTLDGDSSLQTFSGDGDASDDATDEALAGWQSLALAL